MEFLILAFISLLIFFSGTLIIYARWNYGILESLQIPVIPRTFILGSTPDLHRKVQHFEDIERFRKYGKLYGVYEGRTPVVYVCDPALIRLIFVRDFDSFHNRREIDLGDPLVNDFIDFLPVEKWREIRGAMSPIFTTGKLRKMSYAFQEANVEFYQNLLKLIDDQGHNGFLELDIRRIFDGLVMDLICRSAFGIKIGDPLDTRNSFVRMFKDLQGNDGEFGFMYTLSMVFPFLTRFAPTLESDSATKITDIILSLMKARKQEGKTHEDFIDILNKMYEKLSSPEYKKLKIGETAVLAQGINFVLAGYDAICTTLTMLLYYVSKYPEVQNRLIDEIDSFIELNHGEIVYEKLGECVYLTACINETLRLVPPFIRPERICTKDWEHEGLRLKKGILVMAPAWAVNRNPEVYPNPDEFQPERFLPENKGKLNPYAFLTFGHGPRNCVGMRYAYEAMKLSMCHFFKHLRVELCSKTEIKYKPGVLFLIMYDPVYLKVMKRNVN